MQNLCNTSLRANGRVIAASMAAITAIALFGGCGRTGPGSFRLQYEHIQAAPLPTEPTENTAAESAQPDSPSQTAEEVALPLEPAEAVELEIPTH